MDLLIYIFIAIIIDFKDVILIIIWTGSIILLINKINSLRIIIFIENYHIH